MSETILYPLRFEPIYQYRLWGVRLLASLLITPKPSDGWKLQYRTILQMDRAESVRKSNSSR